MESDERGRRIVRALQAGATVTEIARFLDLSHSRIVQIKNRAERRERAFKRIPRERDWDFPLRDLRADDVFPGVYRRFYDKIVRYRERRWGVPNCARYLGECLVLLTSFGPGRDWLLVASRYFSSRPRRPQ
jgi:hypothetical protein